jgi:SOS response regulatory protein OraA/RecX
MPVTGLRARLKIGNYVENKREYKEDIIRDALSRADHGLFLKKLKESLLRKNSAIKDQDPRIRYARLVRFGLGKGYTYSQIQKALERL